MDGVSSNECPVSAITPEIEQFVKRISTAAFANQCFGASLYGPNLQAWPARDYDAAVLVASEANRIDAARHAAIRSRPPQARRREK